MSTITVIGGTGYTGSNLVSEAVRRGHGATAFSRNPPSDPVAGARYVQGTGPEGSALVTGSDVVIATLSPRGDSQGTLLATYQALATAAVEHGVRLIIVGGFSSLRPAPGEPRFVEGDLDPQFAPELLEMDSVREWLQSAAPAGLDWTFVSPASGYGSWAPGTRTGHYRVGGEIALFDADGHSEISGADLAVAIIDEIEQPAHRGEHIGVAY